MMRRRRIEGEYISGGSDMIKNMDREGQSESRQRTTLVSLETERQTGDRMTEVFAAFSGEARLGVVRAIEEVTKHDPVAVGVIYESIFSADWPLNRSDETNLIRGVLARSLAAAGPEVMERIARDMFAVEARSLPFRKDFRGGSVVNGYDNDLELKREIVAEAALDLARQGQTTVFEENRDKMVAALKWSAGVDDQYHTIQKWGGGELRPMPRPEALGQLGYYDCGHFLARLAEREEGLTDEGKIALFWGISERLRSLPAEELPKGERAETRGILNREYDVYGKLARSLGNETAKAQFINESFDEFEKFLMIVKDGDLPKIEEGGHETIGYHLCYAVRDLAEAAAELSGDGWQRTYERIKKLANDGLTTLIETHAGSSSEDLAKGIAGMLKNQPSERVVAELEISAERTSPLDPEVAALLLERSAKEQIPLPRRLVEIYLTADYYKIDRVVGKLIPNIAELNDRQKADMAGKYLDKVLKRDKRGMMDVSLADSLLLGAAKLPEKEKDAVYKRVKGRLVGLSSEGVAHFIASFPDDRRKAELMREYVNNYLQKKAPDYNGHFESEQIGIILSSFSTDEVFNQEVAWLLDQVSAKNNPPKTWRNHVTGGSIQEVKIGKIGLGTSSPIIGGCLKGVMSRWFDSRENFATFGQILQSGYANRAKTLMDHMGVVTLSGEGAKHLPPGSFEVVLGEEYLINFGYIEGLRAYYGVEVGM